MCLNSAIEFSQQYHRCSRIQHHHLMKIGSHGDAFAPLELTARGQVWSALRATGSRLRQIYHPLVLRIADPRPQGPLRGPGRRAWRGGGCAPQTPPARPISPWQPNFDPVTASQRQTQSRRARGGILGGALRFQRVH